MLSDPMTLYKLMNLYMLKHVNFPLTNSQLTDFFLAHEYATYFTLQQALNELSEAGLIPITTLPATRFPGKAKILWNFSAAIFPLPLWRIWKTIWRNTVTA